MSNHAIRTRTASPAAPAADRAVTLRAATGADLATVQRLARLDSQTPPSGPVLLAEVDGVPVAALARETGRVMADPFHPTADVVELLRRRDRAMRGARQTVMSGRSASLRRLRGALVTRHAS